MIKHYCDRCKKETGINDRNNITFQDKKFEICHDCDKLLEKVFTDWITCTN